MFLLSGRRRAWFSLSSIALPERLDEGSPGIGGCRSCRSGTLLSGIIREDRWGEPMTAPLTVIVPTAGGRLPLLRCTLDSLAACRLPAGYCETLIVENGGREGADTVVEVAAPRLLCRYLYVDRGNKSHALNTAVKQASEGLLVFLDDDVRASPHLLMRYVEAMGKVAAGCVYGGPVGVDYEQEPAEGLVKYLPPSARGWSLQTGEPLGTRCFLGLNWAAFRGDLLEAGGFDINHGPGSPLGALGQETQMQQRLRRRGLRSVYVPDAWVWHYVPESRCSAEWLLGREHHRSVAKGLAAGSCARRMALWAKVGLRWMVARLSHLGQRSYAPMRSFKARRHQQIAQGLVVGLRAASRDDRPSEPAATREAEAPGDSALEPLDTSS